MNQGFSFILSCVVPGGRSDWLDTASLPAPLISRPPLEMIPAV